MKLRIFKIDTDFIRAAKADGVPMEVERLVQRKIGVARTIQKLASHKRHKKHKNESYSVLFVPLLWLDSIDAPLIAFDDVFGAFDSHAGSEHGSKQIQLSRAETLARVCRGADRTVILDQQKASVVFLSDLGHVTFFSSDLREFVAVFVRASLPV